MSQATSRALVDAQGRPFVLGRELGRGGEGSVFELAGSDTSYVAKVYHRALSADKQAKLRYMVAHADERLLQYVAWPVHVLLAQGSSAVGGFVMPKASGRSELHAVYSPKQRQQALPRAAWNFLVYVARNVAACVDVVHDHGHVIGDVNQSSFLVGADSKVVLIDSDSFQIREGGKIHFCEVGVSHFTPPELQGLSDFSTFARTPNHDHFGLALLIFHLLMGGRHPYSGVPMQDFADESLEGAIAQFRYAYAQGASSRGVRPPPNSMSLQMLPPPLRHMFELAFTQPGAAGRRPSALQWVQALDALREQLKACSRTPMHQYWAQLPQCPWCALESRGVVYFVDLGLLQATTGDVTVIARVWALIEAVPTPPAVKPPLPGNFECTPEPLPKELSSRPWSVVWLVLFIGVMLFTTMLLPAAWFMWLGAAVAGLVVHTKAGAKRQVELSTERDRRRQAERVAEAAFKQLFDQASKLDVREAFLKAKAELAKAKAELELLPQQQAQAMQQLRSQGRERQLEAFLDRFFIDQAAISGVGPGRKAVLRSFGIETAADVSEAKVSAVRGFGVWSWTCPLSVDSYGLDSRGVLGVKIAGLSTGGVAQPTPEPTVGNPCSMRGGGVMMSMFLLSKFSGDR